MSIDYCPSCGIKLPEKNRFADGLCQSCHVYFRNGGTVHPLPSAGRIEKDERGYVICHICGKAYKRLGSHVKEKHHMSIDEYKEKFGLCRRTRTTEDGYSRKMHDHALANDMDKQLLVVGFETRIQKGSSKMRGGKEVRLQEILEKRDRKGAVCNG